MNREPRFAPQDLGERGIGCQPAAGENASGLRVKPGGIDQILGLADEDFLAMSAWALQADPLRCWTFVVPPGKAGSTAAAAEPGIHDHGSPHIRLGQARSGSVRADSPNDLVSEGGRERNTERCQRQLLIAAQTQIPLLEVGIRVAQPASYDVHDHLLGGGHRVGHALPDDRLAIFNNLICLHRLSP